MSKWVGAAPSGHPVYGTMDVCLSIRAVKPKSYTN
jgi:hypothetical protein